MNKEEFRKKCCDDDENVSDGKTFVELYLGGNFDVILYEKVDDELFMVMSYDYGISDYYIALIFNESNHRVAKRRKSLGIPKGPDRHRKWVDVDNRTRVPLGEFLDRVVINTKNGHVYGLAYGL